MIERQKTESDLQWAIRKATAQNLNVITGLRADGQLIYTINDCNLTADQVLSLDKQGKLTAAGIREFLRQNA